MSETSLRFLLSPFLTEGGGCCFIKTSSPRGEAKMSITSDEVNFLVYRYLQESGKKPASCPERQKNTFQHATCRASNHGWKTRSIGKRELWMLSFRGLKGGGEGAGPSCSWGGMRECVLVCADISVHLKPA